MKRFVLLAAIALGLTACGPAPTSHSESRTFEVTDIDPPKYFRVDLKDVETGQVFQRVRVSKRCSAWRKVTLGSTWTLPVTTYTYEDGEKRVNINARALCQRRSPAAAV